MGPPPRGGPTLAPVGWFGRQGDVVRVSRTTTPTTPSQFSFDSVDMAASKASHKCTASWTPEQGEWDGVDGLAALCGAKAKMVFDCERACGIAKVRGTSILVDFDKKAIIDSTLPCPNAKAEGTETGSGSGAGTAATAPSVRHPRADISSKLTELKLMAGMVHADVSMASLDESYMAGLTETQRHVVQGDHNVAPTRHRQKVHRLVSILITHVLAFANAGHTVTVAGGSRPPKDVPRGFVKKGSASGDPIPMATVFRNIISLMTLIRAVLERYEHLTIVQRDVWMKEKSLTSSAKTRWFDEVALQYAPDFAQVYDMLNDGVSVFGDVTTKIDANAFYVLGVGLVTHNHALVTQWVRAEKKREEDAAKKLGYKPGSSPPSSPPAATGAGAAAGSTTPPAKPSPATGRGRNRGDNGIVTATAPESKRAQKRRRGAEAAAARAASVASGAGTGTGTGT